MDEIQIVGYLYSSLFLCTICCLFGTSAGAVNNSYTVSSFQYSNTELKPYDWRYIRVDVPPWFSSVTIALDSDVDIDPNNIRKMDTSTMPIICVREGSPPLPDVYNTSLTGLELDPISNESLGIKGLQFAEKCYPMQKTIFLRLTNEQIAPGVWYFGLFNGIGSMRTQSKMINRGSSFSFTGKVNVEGCMTEMMSGEFCNQTVHQLSCADGFSFTQARFNISSYIQGQENVVLCRNKDEDSCSGVNEQRTYSLDSVGISQKISIISSNVRLNGTKLSDGTTNSSSIVLMCYARLGTIPSSSTHDYSGNINNVPLVVQSPKVGKWYITVQPLNLSIGNGVIQDLTTKVCYSLQLQVYQCPMNKAGLNCTWETYMLQTVLRKNPSFLFESHYLPASDTVSSDSASFALEPLLSNSTTGDHLSVPWTYFLVNIPSGADGGNIHFRITSDRINYGIYAAYGGLPDDSNWDYYYSNVTSNSNGSMFFKLYDSDEGTVSFYILYAREGTWSFGLKPLSVVGASSKSKNQTTLSLSLERCPTKCSFHGTCQYGLDMSGLSTFSYCACDRNHGSFDCGIELVSHHGHILHSVALIASNAAAILPAYWVLRQKAFAEWVLFTSSGISSALYHACDVGTWCALSFHVLQFMDFWLSFMAVVSTFVYLVAIDEVSKRTIHTIVAILTALMAETEATRSSNIAFVIAIGAVGLLIGWLIELSTHYRSLTFSTPAFLSMLHGRQSIEEWFRNLLTKLLHRFHWGFVLAGFVALAMAATSWTLETSSDYWFWHSMWHVSIYTSSFFFLCSKVNVEDERPPGRNYEPTRQDSSSRIDAPMINGLINA